MNPVIKARMGSRNKWQSRFLYLCFLTPVFSSLFEDFSEPLGTGSKAKQVKAASFSPTDSGRVEPVQRIRQHSRVVLNGSEKFTKGSLAEVLHLGESRRRGVNDYNTGSDSCKKSNRRSINFSKMTVRKLMARQALPPCTKYKLFAVGYWQVIPETFLLAKDHLGLGMNDTLNSKVQNRIFTEFLTVKKRPPIYKYITTGKGLNNAGLAVAQEWASMQSPMYFKSGKVVCRRGTGCYDGWGSNKAHTDYRVVFSALRQARSTYLKLTAQGFGHKKSFAIALGVNNL